MSYKNNQFSEKNLTLSKNKRIGVPPDRNGTFVAEAMNRIVHAALIGLLLSAAGCSKGYDPEPPQRPPVPVPTVTIAEFQKLCLDGATVIREPIVLTGIVTTSDRSGNFYRTLGIEQNRSAVEIRTGTENSHTRYPVGSRVCLRVQGLCVERQRGVLQIGPTASPSSAEAVGYFRAQSLLDCHLFCGEREEPLPTGTPRTPDELDTALCGTLVLLSGFRYEPEDEEEPCWEGYRRFVDDEGFAIHTYVSSYARFARQPIPAGRVALRGMLQRIDTGPHAGYIIKLRDETDCLD